MMYDESVASRAGISDFRRRRAEAALRRGRGDLYGDFGVLKLQQPAQRVSPEQLGTEKVLLALFFLITISFGK